MKQNKNRTRSLILAFALLISLLLASCGTGSADYSAEPTPPGSGVVESSTPEPSETPSDKPEDGETSVLAPPSFDEGKSYLTYKLNVDNNGKNIAGRAYIPRDAEGPLPTVILSHGFNNTYNNMQSYALDLTNNGYIAVLFDFCGGSKSSTSDGESTEMSIFTEQSDLLTVFTAIQGLEQVDADHIFLLGASQGGLVTAITAAELGNQVKAAVLIYPALSAPDDARTMYPSADEIPDTIEYMGLTVGKVYFESTLDYDPYEVITAYTGDVLVIHGTADDVVPYEYGVRASEEYASAQFVTIEGGGHGFSGQDLDTATAAIREFLGGHVS